MLWFRPSFAWSARICTGDRRAKGCRPRVGRDRERREEAHLLHDALVAGPLGGEVRLKGIDEEREAPSVRGRVLTGDLEFGARLGQREWRDESRPRREGDVKGGGWQAHSVTLPGHGDQHPLDDLLLVADADSEGAVLLRLRLEARAEVVELGDETVQRGGPGLGLAADAVESRTIG